MASSDDSISDIECDLISTQPPTPTKRELHNVTFSGGGFKGAAFLGCIKAIHEYNLLPNIKAVAGSSAGAIAATLLACKADYAYIRSCLVGVLKHFEKYRVNWFNLVKNAKLLTDEYGIHKTDEIRLYFKECINNATDTDNDITFHELFQKTNIKLIITATCLDNSTPFYFSHETTKDTPISEALTISVNIPLLFTSKRFDNKTLVDGCIVEHLPMQCWRDEETKNTIAFLVKSKNEHYIRESSEIDNVYEYIQKLVATMKRNDENWYYTKYSDIITIINAGNISAYNKIPTKDEINTVVYSSYFQTIRAFNERKFINTNHLTAAALISSYIVADIEESESEIDNPTNDRVINCAYNIILILSLLIFIIILTRSIRRM